MQQSGPSGLEISQTDRCITKKEYALRKFIKYTLIFFAGLAFYAVTVVPVGMFLYTWKTKKGINIFDNTGFHSYLSCLRQEAYKAAVEEKQNIQKSVSGSKTEATP